MATVSLGLSFFANGISLACALKEWGIDPTVTPLDSTTLCKTAKTFELGLKDGKFTASGVWDYSVATADKIYEVLSGAFNNSAGINITGSLDVIAVGGLAIMFNAKETQYSVKTPLNQLVMADVQGVVDGGTDVGIWLYNKSLTNTSENGTTYDGTAATGNGGIGFAHLQNTDATIASCTVKFQHSTDGSSWADLTTAQAFTANATNYGYLTVTVVPSVVRRYLRVVVVTSGGTAFVEAAFARR